MPGPGMNRREVLSADTSTVTTRPGATALATALGLNFQGAGIVTVTVSPKTVVVDDRLPTPKMLPFTLGTETTGIVVVNPPEVAVRTPVVRPTPLTKNRERVASVGGTRLPAAS